MEGQALPREHVAEVCCSRRLDVQCWSVMSESPRALTPAREHSRGMYVFLGAVWDHE